MTLSALGLGSDAWTALNAVASSLAAVATFAAVVVALRLARREKEVRVLVRAELVEIVDRRRDVISSSHFAFVTIVSASYIPTTVTKVLWRTRGRRPFVFAQEIPIDESTPLPVELTHGNPAVLKCPANDMDFRLNDVILALRGVAARGLDVGVETALGQRFFHPMDRRLQTFLLDQFRSNC